MFQVDYLQFVGGFTAKEAINLCFKEVLKDETTTAFTWFGREEDSRSLYNTRIIKAIYGIVFFKPIFSISKIFKNIFLHYF